MRTDEELMAAYKGGDAAAFRELFDRHSPVLLRVMRHHLRRPEDARDLVQQTFLQLHRSRNDFREGAQLRPWLFTIAMNLKREYFRRTGRKPETALDLDGRDEPGVAPREYAQLEAAEVVRFALTRSPKEQREVMELHWRAGMTLTEDVVLVRDNLIAVKLRAHRAYAGTRRVLGGDSTTPERI